MTDREKELEQEVLRLNRKLRDMRSYYDRRIMELEQQISAGADKETEKRKRGRPALDQTVRTRVLALRHQGDSMAVIGSKTGVSAGAVQKIIKEARERSFRYYVYMNREQPCTVILVNHLERKVMIRNLTEDLLSRAFGRKERPDWEDYLGFMEERCMPRSRYGIKEELRQLGLDVYEPEEIIAKTEGRVYGDAQWIYIPDRETYPELALLFECEDQKEAEQKLCRRILAYLDAAHAYRGKEESGDGI